MAGKALEVHPAALDELKSALIWYAERSEAAANNFIRELEAGLEMVLQSPDRWPLGERATRKFTLKRFPFAIVYRETNRSIQVVAIAHGHRRPGYGGYVIEVCQDRPSPL
jgi:plasmid stabilization system protein ParE